MTASSSTAEQTMRDYLEKMWNAHDLQSFPQWVRPDVVFHPPRGAAVGFDDYLKMAEDFVRGFPDLRFEIEEMVSRGDLVAARIRITGTHRGEWHGHAPTGRRIDVEGRPWGRFRDGRVAEFWSHWDQLGALQQLGVV